MWLERRCRLVGLLATTFVLFAVPALMADDQRAVPSKIPLSVHVTAVLGIVLGNAILATVFFFCRALFRFARAQTKRTAGSSWRGTFDTTRYANEGRTLLAGALKDIGISALCVLLAAAAIAGLRLQ